MVKSYVLMTTLYCVRSIRLFKLIESNKGQFDTEHGLHI